MKLDQGPWLTCSWYLNEAGPGSMAHLFLIFKWSWTWVHGSPVSWYLNEAGPGPWLTCFLIFEWSWTKVHDSLILYIKMKLDWGPWLTCPWCWSGWVWAPRQQTCSRPAQPDYPAPQSASLVFDNLAANFRAFRCEMVCVWSEMDRPTSLLLEGNNRTSITHR
jgi:hypothetical protein